MNSLLLKGLQRPFFFQNNSNNNDMYDDAPGKVRPCYDVFYFNVEERNEPVLRQLERVVFKDYAVQRIMLGLPSKERLALDRKIPGLAPYFQN
jgi:hypothetical protein